MSISLEDMRHVAKLAALQVSESELLERQREIGDILAYVDKLGSLSTRGIPPTSHVHGLVNAFREDIVTESLTVQEVEAIAPDFQNNAFRVPKIL